MKVSNIGKTTTPLGRLFLWLIVLIVKNCSLVFTWNFPRRNLYPLLFVLSMQLFKKGILSSLKPSCKYWNMVTRSALSLLFSRLKKIHFSKAFFFIWRASYRVAFASPFVIQLGAEQHSPAQCRALKRPCPRVCKN